VPHIRLKGRPTTQGDLGHLLNRCRQRKSKGFPTALCGNHPGMGLSAKRGQAPSLLTAHGAAARRPMRGIVSTAIARLAKEQTRNGKKGHH